MISYRTWQQFMVDPNVGSTFFTGDWLVMADWDYASGIFMKGHCVAIPPDFGCPCNMEICRRPECAHENESSPVVRRYWQG